MGVEIEKPGSVAPEGAPAGEEARNATAPAPNPNFADPEATTLDCPDGRRISVAAPDILAEFDWTLAIGPEAAQNDRYFQMIQPLMYLTHIEEEGRLQPVARPRTKAEVDALIQRLGRSGMAALSTWYMVTIAAPIQAAVQGAMDAQEAHRRAAVKNS